MKNEDKSREAKESLRTPKSGANCTAILIDVSRKKKHVVPIGFQIIDVFLKAGFKLKGLVNKRLHNYKTIDLGMG